MAGFFVPSENTLAIMRALDKQKPAWNIMEPLSNHPKKESPMKVNKVKVWGMKSKGTNEILPFVYSSRGLARECCPKCNTIIKVEITEVSE